MLIDKDMKVLTAAIGNGAKAMLDVWKRLRNAWTISRPSAPTWF